MVFRRIRGRCTLRCRYEILLFGEHSTSPGVVDTGLGTCGAPRLPPSPGDPADVAR